MIPLTQGKVALVDDADFKVVNAFKWHTMKIGRRFYAARKICNPDGKQTTQYLHHFLTPGVVRIDHRDGDGLNNQRYNLRPATHKQNLRGFQRKRLDTTSQFRGVSWNKEMSKWEARIKVDGKKTHLGYFKSEIAAALVYDTAARKYFGEFACPNFP